MFVVTIDADACAGCSQCAASCPAQILSMVEAKAQVTGNTDECLGCQSCVIVCDLSAVTVQEF